MVDRLDYKIVGLAFLFLLCWMGYIPLAGRGAVVWSDDFNDGDYDGWTIVENPSLASQYPDVGFSGSNWSAANNYLQLDQDDLGIISHPSDVAYGIWSFDFFGNETNEGFQASTSAWIVFISNGLILTTDDFEETHRYWVNFVVTVTEGEDMYWGISLRKYYGGVSTIIDSYETPVPSAAWHHIDVTRTEAGQFTVYHNGSLIMQGTDTDIDTSELFYCWFDVRRMMIDNIVVDDAPPGIPIEVLVLGIGGAAVAIVAVVVFLRRR